MLKNIIKFDNFLILLFSLFPITFLIGNLLINSSILIISIAYITGIIFKKVKFKLNDKFFLLLIFFFITLLINLFFSNNISLSYERILKFFFIIFFILAFRHLINLKNNHLNYIYKLWSLTFTIVCIDLIFEFFAGFNLIGLKSYLPGRLGGFTGGKSVHTTELVIGNYFFAFVLLSLSYFYKNYLKSNFLKIFVALILILISFFIGERSNFIKTAIIISLFIFFIYEINIKKKLLSIFFIIFFFIIFLYSNENYRLRYIQQPINILQKQVFKDGNIDCSGSNHCAHYKVAIKIFKDNPIFGVGIKNFRIESFDNKYSSKNENQIDIWSGGSTHPHQIHFEFLSETGAFGYLSFLLFITLSIYWSFKSYLIKKNIYQFSAMLFLIASMIPLLPSGSFFTTYYSGLFWINYAIMIGYAKKN